jgi:hypothetical protein
MEANGLILLDAVQTKIQMVSNRLFPLMIGHEYSLDFFTGNLGPRTTSDLAIYINGYLAEIRGGGSSNPTMLGWAPNGIGFYALGTSTTIAFINHDPPNVSSNGLDNVSVEDLGLVTPEPSAASLLTVGLMCLLAVRVFRSSRG